MPLNKNWSGSNFDIDLAFAGKFEEQIRSIFEDGGKIEVKTENEIWKETGNIAIEIRYKGRRSGLSSTEAEYWIHILAEEGKMFTAFIFPVDRLKALCKKLLRKGIARVVKGGDGFESEIILLPISSMFTNREYLY